MYTAVVLDEPSRAKLIQSLQSLSSWDGQSKLSVKGSYRFQTTTLSPLPHHLTLNMGGISEGLNDSNLLGKGAAVTVDGFCWNDSLGVCAARVTFFHTNHPYKELRSTNKQPHITMCLLPHGKPVQSNNLDWSQTVLLKELITLDGLVQEC